MAFNIFGMPINLLDATIVIVLLVSILRGVIIGFIDSLSRILGVLAGFWAAMNFHQVLDQRLALLVENPTIRFLISFLLIFFSIYLFFAITGHLLRYVMNSVRLGWLDRWMGLLMGAAKGLLVIGIICFLLTVLLPQRSPILRRSYLYPRLSTVFRSVIILVPSDIRAKFMWRWRRIIMDKSKGEKVSI